VLLAHICLLTCLVMSPHSFMCVSTLLYMFGILVYVWGAGNGSGVGAVCMAPPPPPVGSFAASRLLHAQRKEAHTLLKHQLEPAARRGARPAASSPHPFPSQAAPPISHSHMSLTKSGNGCDVDDEDVGTGDEDVGAGDHRTHHAPHIAEHLTAHYVRDGRKRERKSAGTLASEKIGWSLEGGRRGGGVMRSFETLSVEVPVTPGFVPEHPNTFMPPPRSIERGSDERESRERESRERESIESVWRPSASRESLQSDAAEVEEEVVVEDGMGGGGWGSDDSDSVYHLSPRTPASPGSSLPPPILVSADHMCPQRCLLCQKRCRNMILTLQSHPHTHSTVQSIQVFFF
jgi:hypothetical protein